MDKPRVLAAMSGGVDSSVAAALLLDQGYEVVGATLNLWSYEERDEPYNECCSLEVKIVADQLGIEHHWVDEGIDFKRDVVEPFIEDYIAGMTPSPCARCNRLVRFPKLLELADKLDCQYLATGHHAQIAQHDGLYHLYKGADPFKDQSYYMYGLDQSQLSRILFPVGDMCKSRVWEIAEAKNLVSARKPESQDLCFLPFGDQRKYLQQQAGDAIQPGEIVDLDGNVLGEHQGLAYYTIGQRRGLDLPMGYKIYVVALDADSNRVIVGPEEALYSDGLIADQVRFPSELPEDGQAVEVKIRYRSKAFPGQLQLNSDDSTVRVLFDEPQRAVTPGQIAVFYEEERLIGGGRICSPIREQDPAPVLNSQLSNSAY